MSHNFKLFISSLLCLGVSLFVYGKYVREPVKRAPVHLAWTRDLKAALASAAQSGKPIMIDFNAIWCEPCQEYRREVFNTDEFVAESKKFELVDIDVDEQQALAKQFGIQPIPDIWFLNSKGQALMHVVGFDGPELVLDMQKALDFAKQPAPAQPLMKQATAHCDD